MARMVLNGISQGPVRVGMNSISLCGFGAVMIALALSSCVGYDPYAYSGPGGLYSGYGPAPILAPRTSRVSYGYFNTTPAWNRSYSTARANYASRSAPAYCPPTSNYRRIGHHSSANVPVLPSSRHGHSSSPAFSGPSRSSGASLGGMRSSSGFGGSRVSSPSMPSMRQNQGGSSGSGHGSRSSGSVSSSRYPMVHADGSSTSSNGGGSSPMDRLRRGGGR